MVFGVVSETAWVGVGVENRERLTGDVEARSKVFELPTSFLVRIIVSSKASCGPRARG